MSTLTGSRNFKAEAREALADPVLRRALGNLKGGFPVARARVVEALPEFDELRDAARDLKNHVLANLDGYLEIFERNVTAAGGHVHWARDAEEACSIVLDLCRKSGAGTVTKGKSMVAEEIGLNEALASAGMKRVETDLGEYIVQLRDEVPSHIIVPAVHVTKDGIADTFRAAHVDRDPARSLEEPSDLTAEARAELRNHYFAAEVGITGANFLIAETGSTVIVTNEGNGDLTQTFAKTHIVVTSIEKVVPTLDDAMTLARVLARSSTGQEFSVYTTVSTGPRRPGDVDGPEAFHVVLVDNGRSAMLGGDFQDMLRCIRCAACMNHCPVYAAVGGHAYGWVYPGPMGAVLTPSLHGHAEARHLPNASTFCGRCEQVCPVRIPLPGLMRKYREREHEQRLAPPIGRILIGLWAALARRPALYRLATGIAGKALSAWAGRRGRLSSVPLAGGWTGARDLPAPAARSFMERYRAGERR